MEDTGQKSSEGIVVQVPFGDTVLVEVLDGATKDITLTLSQLTVPVQSIKTSARTTGDEPCGFEAREWLRRVSMGRKIFFSIQYVAGGKKYAVCRLSSGPHRGVTLNEGLLREGYARLRTMRSPSQPKWYKLMIAAEQEARSASRGVWAANSKKTVRSVTYSQGDSAFCSSFAKSNHGQLFDGVVEFVRDGGCVRVYLSERAVYCQLLVAGVQADPLTSRRDDAPPGGQTTPAPAFAVPAKEFLAQKVLHRDVRVRVLGADDNGNLIGSLEIPKGDLGVLMLGAGLVDIHESSLRLRDDAAELRRAIADAKREKLKKWSDFRPRQYLRKYHGQVIEVVTGDIVILADGESVRRLYLASVRAPRMGSPGTARKPEPWSQQSKDFLIEQLIGKEKVLVCVDYARDAFVSASGVPIPSSDEESGKMHFVSIFYKKNNKDSCINADVVRAGLASVSYPRSGNEERALNFETLVEAEAEAKRSSRHMHGTGKEPAETHINDICSPGNAHRARAMEPSLKRSGALDAFVEHCFTAGRYKLRIPSEGLAVSFILGDIRTPQTNIRRGGVPDPMLEESLLYARRHFMQRKVRATIESCDRGGNFIGVMTLPNEKISANVKLVAEGFAYISNSPARMGIKDALEKAQSAAKERQLGIWSPECGWLERGEETAKQIDENQCVDIGNILVTYVERSGNFYIQRETKARIISKLQADLRNLPPPQNSDMFTNESPPSNNMYVLVKSPQDGSSYRAKITATNRASQEVQVLCIDYGNSERVSYRDIRRLPEQFSTQMIPHLAQMCTLAGVKPVKSFEDLAATRLMEITDGVLYHGKNLKTDRQGRMEVYLVPQSGEGISVNEALLRTGAVTVRKQFADEALRTCFIKASTHAMDAKAGIFKYRMDLFDSNDECDP